jgi:type IV pilus assembly protein PilX
MMSPTRQRRRHAQRGLVLVSSLLLLLIVTILAVAMFRSFGIQEQIAGNTREKQRALHAAESAQTYAEWFLSSGNAGGVVNCTTLMVVSSPGQGQICQNKLTDLTGNNVGAVPWLVSGAPVGVEYTPPGMLVDKASKAGTYYAAPRFYISYLGLTQNATAGVYQIDAVGYGGTPNAVAVVESTYMVSTGVRNLGGL